MAAFYVPGYDVLEMIGFGATGEVWLAREAAGGAPVALKRLRTPSDLAGRDRLRREAAVLAGVSHPHVVRLRGLLSAGDELVLVLDHAPGGSLAGVLTGRGVLSAGEVVTVATPLAEALAAVHARGVLHGDVKPANVLFAADGRPLLADLGVCRLVGEPVIEVDGTRGYVDPAVVAGAVPVPESDVYGLGAVCFAALTGGPPAADGDRRPLAELAPAAPAALVGVVEAALEPDPARRMSAAELASAVFDSCPARPVRLAVTGLEPGVAAAGASPGRGHADTGVGGEPDVVPTHRVRAEPAGEASAPTRPSHRSHRGTAARPRLPKVRWQAVAAGFAALSGVAMAALTGLAWAGTDQSGAGGVRAARLPREATTTVATPTAKPVTPTAATSLPPTPVTARSSDSTRPSSWRRVLARLDAARSAAFARADPEMLGQVYPPGAPALARDRALLDQLSAAGARASGLRLAVRSLRVVSATDRRVVLRVVDVLRPYVVVRSDGRAEPRPGRGEARWLVTLVRVDARWRVHEVTASVR